MLQAVILNMKKINGISKKMKVFSDPTRLAILALLSKTGEMAVSDFLKKVKVEPSLLSHHLKTMKVAGLVSSKRVGNSVVYKMTMGNINFSRILEIF